MGSHRSKTEREIEELRAGFVAIWDHTVLKPPASAVSGSWCFVAIWDHTVLKPYERTEILWNSFVAIWDHTVLKLVSPAFKGSHGFVAIWDHTVLKRKTSRGSHSSVL